MGSLSRAVSAGERSATQGNRWSFFKLRATNPDGAWLDLGNLTVNGSPARNFVNTAQIAKSIDENTLQLNATVRREIGAYSLAPLKTDSALNVRADFTYATTLDIRRRWEILVAVMPWGVAPSATSYRPLAEGIITALDISGAGGGEPGIITLSGRGRETKLLAIEMLSAQTYIGATIEDRLQAMLDRWNAGETVTPDPSTAPSYFVNPATADSPQPVGNLMTAVQEIAALPGAVLRFMYDTADVNQFTLFTPDRNPSAADYQLGPREYKAIPLNRLDLDPVRTYVEVTYLDETLGAAVTITSPAPEPSTVSAVAGVATFSASPGATIADGAVIVVAGVAYTVSDYTDGGTTATLDGAPTFAASAWVTSGAITRYGLRPFTIGLAQSTNVTTLAAAGALADAIRSDLEFPAVEWQIESEGLWFAELYDYVELLPNRTHHSESQFVGVTSVTHTFAGGKLMTTLGLRGKPAGGYRSWLTFGSNAPRALPTAGVTSSSATFKEELIGVVTINRVDFVCTVNDYTRSIEVAVYDTPDFSGALYDYQTYDASSAAPISGTLNGIAGLPRELTYYAKITPYSGPLDGSSVPTGTPGPYAAPNTSSLPAFVDTPTASFDLSTPGEVKVNVTAIDPGTLPPEVVGAGSGAAQVPFFAYGSAEEVFNDIPAAETEVHTRLRRPALLSGMGAARLVGTLTEATAGGEVLRVGYGVAGASTLTPISGGDLPLARPLGPVRGDWFAVPGLMQGDVDLGVFRAGGDGTTRAKLSSLTLQASPTTRSGGGTPAPGGGGGGDITAGLFWWYDAQALAGLSNLDPLATWPDASGNANDATADVGTAAYQPHYYTGAINGHPAVRFESFGGNGRGYAMPGTFNPSEGHLFIVCRIITAGPPYQLGDRNIGYNFPATSDGSGIITDHFGSSVARTVGAAGVDTTAGFIYHAHSVAGLWEADVGATPAYSDGTNTPTWDVAAGHKLGYFLYAGATAVVGDLYIGEFRVYSGALSGADVTTIVTALGTKWGITP